MKTRLFAALAAVTVVSILSSDAAAGERTSWSAIKGGFSEAPKKIQLGAGRGGRVSLNAENIVSMTVEQQVRYAKILGYHEVPAPGADPSLGWLIGFNGYVDYLAARTGIMFLSEADVRARDLSQDVPEVLSWSQKRMLAQAVGFGLIGADYDNPTATDLTALKRWNKNLFSHIGRTRTVPQAVKIMKDVTEDILDLS